MYIYIFLFFFFNCLYGNEQSLSSKGHLVVFAGISGSGKSSLTREIAKRSNAICFLEPEEKEWPDFVQKKQFYGEFGSLMAIRSIRVHNLWNAWELRQNGNLVFVDTYYDKIHTYYIEKPGMEWLINPKDPYFHIAKQVFNADHLILPNADLIILIDVNYEDWIKMLTMRNRTKDSVDNFQENYAIARQYLFDAVRTLSLEKSIPFIIFHQNFGNLDQQADLLYELLKSKNLFLKPINRDFE